MQLNICVQQNIKKAKYEECVAKLHKVQFQKASFFLKHSSKYFSKT